MTAALGASITDIGPWYRGLAKPDWTPPDPVFGIAWTIIYALTATSAVVAWRRAPTMAAREWVIGLFALNGFLNVLWSLLFFRLRRPDIALWEVVALALSVVLIAVYVRAFAPISAWLLVPYLAWAVCAGALNLAVVRLNPDFG